MQQMQVACHVGLSYAESHTSYAEITVASVRALRYITDVRQWCLTCQMEFTMQYAKNITRNPITHTSAWRSNKKSRLANTAEIAMLVNFPRWAPGSRGADFWAKVLGPETQNGTVSTTVQALVAKAETVGLKAHRVHSMLHYLYTWGDQCTINGQRYVSVVPVATPKQKKVA